MKPLKIIPRATTESNCPGASPINVISVKSKPLVLQAVVGMVMPSIRITTMLKGLKLSV